MVRIEYDRYGGPEELHVVDVNTDAPQKDQIRVVIKAASINPIDWSLRQGKLKLMTGSKFPRGVGQDFAGIVEAVGSAVTKFKVGDEVFGQVDLKHSGSFAESVVTAEQTATLKPADLTFVQAATLATVGKTAWGALIDVAHLQTGQRVFVSGCLGGVGRTAVQIARMFDARVSGSCSASGLHEAKALGVENPVDYNFLDLQQFKGRFDIVFDTSGHLTVRQCSQMLNREGVALHINGELIKMLQIMLTPRNKLVFVKTTSEILAKVGQAASQGKLALPICKTVPLAEAIPALIALERTGQPKGKVVVTPE